MFCVLKLSFLYTCSTGTSQQKLTRHLAAFAFNKLRESNPKALAQKSRNPAIKAKVKDLLIECKRPQYNLLKAETSSNTKSTHLASIAWFNRKSNGDFFIIHRAGKEELGIERNTGTFEEAGISSQLSALMKSQGFESPTEIQAEGIRPILEGHNVLLAAETGCGKTLAYLLPLVQQIVEWRLHLGEEHLNSPLGIVITPSRELALQIAEIARDLARNLLFSSKVLIGGRTKRKMENPSFQRTDLLIATLGALSKLTTTGVYNMSHVRHVVLDEADTLLDDSFNEKLRHFLRKFPFQFRCHRVAGEKPEGAQLTLASATMPTTVGPILEGIVAEDSLVQLKTPGLHRVLPNVSQKFLRIGRRNKPEELLRVVKAAIASNTPTLIFSNKSPTCDWISMFLNESGIDCLNLNGEMPLPLRRGKFDKFQKGEVNVLSATDIGSRGLNTVRAGLVLNYDFPVYMADYIHRCGRTGRVGLGGSASGRVISFVSGSLEVKLVQDIETAARTKNALPNVNANITKIIEDKTMRRIERDMK